MAAGNFLSKIRLRLNERLTSIWKLLSDTTVYLSHTKVFSNYEQQLKRMRKTLQQSNLSSREIDELRKEIVQLRKSLRHAGHDVSLGGYAISFQGFKNDSCLAEGFSRVVIRVYNNIVIYLAGQDNHLALAEFLGQKALKLPGKSSLILESYLWYKWQGKTLILAGSDSEDKNNFERLKDITQANMLFMLKWLKNL